MTTAKPRRGEVWLAHLDKVRPVVVLTRDPMGAILNDVIVAPITTRVRDLPTEVWISQAEGLTVDSVAVLDGTQLVGRVELVRRIGRVNPDTMARICDALHIAVGCD